MRTTRRDLCFKKIKKKRENHDAVCVSGTNESENRAVVCNRNAKHY